MSCGPGWVRVLEWLDAFTLIRTNEILSTVWYGVPTMCEPLSDYIRSMSALNPFQHKQPQRHQHLLDFRCGLGLISVSIWL